MKLYKFCLLFMFVASNLEQQATADDVSFSIKDTKNKLVEHAVVALTPQFETTYSFASSSSASMRQKNTLFAPFVLPVKVGTKVSFPNMDEFRHHVYSFSKSNRFQLKLYGKDESKEILFDNPGVVALGCNIHDNMLAFVYVTEAPIYKKTNAKGVVNFADLPEGQYKIEIWHPDLKDRKSVFSKMIDIKGSTVQSVELALRSSRRKQHPPSEDEYN